MLLARAGRWVPAATEILTGDGLEGASDPSSSGSRSPWGAGDARRLRLRGVRRGSGNVDCERVIPISANGWSLFIINKGATGTWTCDGPATGSSAYSPSMSSLFVGTGASSCEKDAKTGGREEGRTVLRGGDLTALMRGAGLCAGARFALRARSTATNPNGSESEALDGVPRLYSCRTVVARSGEWTWSTERGKGELGGRDEEERE